MKFEKVLAESFRLYKLHYKGTRPRYKIHDPNPLVLALDDDYDNDGNGRSILGINLNYFNGNIKKIISDVNRHDDKFNSKSYEINSEIDRKKKRYQTFIEEFPLLGKFMRRYKFTGPKGTGIQNKNVLR